MIRLATIKEIIQFGQCLMDIPSIHELYLTECRGCCSPGDLMHNSSYRLFSVTPKFSEYTSQQGTRHPDTGLNTEKILAKIYGQQVRVADLVAKEIVYARGQALDISGEEDIPNGAIIWKLKGL